MNQKEQTQALNVIEDFMATRPRLLSSASRVDVMRDQAAKHGGKELLDKYRPGWEKFAG